MEKITLNFKHPCIQCGNKTMSRCVRCKRSLCSRCRSKKPISISFHDDKILAGLCKDCTRLILEYESLRLASDFFSFLSTLPEK